MNDEQPSQLDEAVEPHEEANIEATTDGASVIDEKSCLAALERPPFGCRSPRWVHITWRVPGSSGIRRVWNRCALVKID